MKSDTMSGVDAMMSDNMKIRGDKGIHGDTMHLETMHLNTMNE